MKLIKRFKQILKNPKDIFYYFQGNIRCKLYYSDNWSFIMKEHIKDQIDFRVEYMDKDCYNKGNCKLCGCETIALQMANKSCDKPCYPPLMRIKDWSLFKHTHKAYVDKTGKVWKWDRENKELNYTQYYN